MVLARLTSVTLVEIDSYTMCKSYTLTRVICILYTVLIEISLQCFIGSVSLRGPVMSNSRAEISSSKPLYFKAVKGAQLGSALVCLFQL